MIDLNRMFCDDYEKFTINYYNHANIIIFVSNFIIQHCYFFKFT